MSSAIHPHIFRFEDNTGAILTRFSRVIRRSVGIIHKYNQTIERVNTNLKSTTEYQRAATQSLRQIVSELDNSAKAVTTRRSYADNRSSEDVLKPLTAALPAAFFALLQRLATFASSFVRIIQRVISVIKNSLSKRTLLKPLKNILLTIGDKIALFIRQREDRIRVREIARLANERSRQVSEVEEALIFRKRTLERSKEELRRSGLLDDVLELSRINSARLTDNYLKLDMETGKFDKRTADLIVTFLKTAAELPHHRDRLTSVIQDQKEFIDEVTRFYKESKQALQNLKSQAEKLQKALQDLENQLVTQQKILQAIVHTLATMNRDLTTHSTSIATIAQAHSRLSEQIGVTVRDVLSGAVSFKEAWESLGRGVLDTVKHLGRQLLDSLLGSVRDMGRQLSDVIFGQVHGALGSFGLGASRGFLPSVPPTVLMGLGGGTPNRI